MLKYIKDRVDAVKDMNKLLKDLNKGCKETVSSIRRNGIVLDEFKDYDFKHLSEKNKKI